MKFTIKLERTFAGKQFENTKPCLEMHFDDDESLEKTVKRLNDMSAALESFGAEWKKKVLNSEGTAS